jgi:hypothetical protein
VIVASLVLILGAVVLLVLGLISGSSGLLVGSIGTSLLAAVALVVGVRQAGAARAAAGLDEDEQFDSDEVEEWSHRSAGQRSYREEPARALVPPRGEPGGWADEPVLAATAVSVPSQSAHEQPVHDRPPDRLMQDDPDDEDPPDEPVAQRVTAADAARVARMSAEVLVIDGRPRYHVPGCVHLLGRPCEPLAVSEAVELGFSPCGLCEPDSALLADARRV